MMPTHQRSKAAPPLRAIAMPGIGHPASRNDEAVAASYPWVYGRVVLGIFLVGLCALLASTWMPSVDATRSTSTAVVPGLAAMLLQQQQQQQPQQVLQHPDLKAVADKLNCKEVLAAGREYSSETVQLLQYGETGGRPLLLDNRTDVILWWIMNDPGEKKVHSIFRHLLSTGCDSSKVFVDVGSNAGVYSTVALAHGCQVLAFDPQPACAQLIKKNMCLNAHYPSMANGAGVAVVNRPVSDVPSEISMMISGPVSQPWCDGKFSVDMQHKSAVDVSTDGAKGATFVKKTVSLDDLLLNSTLQLYLVKIDTEGFELSVLRSMRKLLAGKRVAYMMVEVTPVFWARDGLAREDVYKEFSALLKLGCAIQRALDVNFASKSWFRGPDPLLNTQDKLKEYLVDREFVQEDLLVSCPTA